MQLLLKIIFALLLVTIAPVFSVYVRCMFGLGCLDSTAVHVVKLQLWPAYWLLETCLPSVRLYMQLSGCLDNFPVLAAAVSELLPVSSTAHMPFYGLLSLRKVTIPALGTVHTTTAGSWYSGRCQRKLGGVQGKSRLSSMVSPMHCVHAGLCHSSHTWMCLSHPYTL